MKWENRDINVVWQTKIPKFGKLEDIGTHLRFFELFFDDELIDMIVDYNKLYCDERKQARVLKLKMKHFA